MFENFKKIKIKGGCFEKRNRVGAFQKGFIKYNLWSQW